MNDEIKTDAERQVLRRQSLVDLGFTPEHAQQIDEIAARAVASAMASWQAVLMDPTLPPLCGAPACELAIAWLVSEARKTEALMQTQKAEALRHAQGLSMEEMVAELRAAGIEVTVARINDNGELETIDAGAAAAEQEASPPGTRH